MEAVLNRPQQFFRTRTPSSYEVVLTREETKPFTYQKKDYLKEEVMEILAECGSENWDEKGARPVTPATAKNARELISNLPEIVKKPEVMAMPSGKISFQWIHDNNATIISLDGEGHLLYATISKEGKKNHGIDAFLGSLPSDISEHLLQVFA